MELPGLPLQFLKIPEHFVGFCDLWDWAAAKVESYVSIFGRAAVFIAFWVDLAEAQLKVF